MMKTLKALVVASVMAAVVSSQAAVVTLSGSSLADMLFSGGNFDFQTKTKGLIGKGYQWIGTTDTRDVYGIFSQGPWGLGGPVTTSGDTQTAPVGGNPATLTIYDGAVNATATLTWGKISTTGAGGSINTEAVANITSFLYSGTDTTLLAFRDAITGPNKGTLVLSFQFDHVRNLDQLFATSAYYKASYSIIMSSVPEPTTLAAGALLMIPFGLSTIRVLRNRCRE